MLTINFDDLQGRSPLHHAAFMKDLETIKLLLHHGAKATSTDYQVYHATQTNLSTASGRCDSKQLSGVFVAVANAQLSGLSRVHLTG